MVRQSDKEGNMREDIVALLKKARDFSAAVNQNLFEVYEFILECEGLAPID
jgi:hypothetical protein